MKITIRKSADRGLAEHGWLRSHHTFSFADYHDPAHMGFRSLRVINEDHVAPNGGFPTHPHRDMEIFSFIVAGSLAHKDSMGNGRVLKPGQIQLMSAGSGVTHSEFNPSAKDALHLLQIWITPRERRLEPSYTEWHPDATRDGDAKVLVISPDGRDGSATIHQDAEVFRVRLRAGQAVSHGVHTGRGMWLQIISGSVSVNGVALTAGDAASTEDEGTLLIVAGDDAEALLFDLA